ncbi:MAG: hypothetical protein WAS07_07850 [Micropruina sp.]
MALSASALQRRRFEPFTGRYPVAGVVTWAVTIAHARLQDWQRSRLPCHSWLDRQSVQTRWLVVAGG